MASGAPVPEHFNLVHPDHYAEWGYPHEIWTRLRREDPVHGFDRSDGIPFWAITKHADIVQIRKHPDRYQNGPRLVIGADRRFNRSFEVR
jgi:hypothetical protein